MARPVDKRVAKSALANIASRRIVDLEAANFAFPRYGFGNRIERPIPGIPNDFKDFPDPVRRVALYEGNGARSLPVAYFQPALRPGASRVPHLLLMVSGGSAVPPGAGRVDGTVVERFLKEYFELCEGPPRADDPEYYALLGQCRRPGGLPLLLVKDLPPLN